jgi:hypothetical protein
MAWLLRKPVENDFQLGGLSRQVPAPRKKPILQNKNPTPARKLPEVGQMPPPNALNPGGF